VEVVVRAQAPPAESGGRIRPRRVPRWTLVTRARGKLVAARVGVVRILALEALAEGVALIVPRNMVGRTSESCALGLGLATPVVVGVRAIHVRAEQILVVRLVVVPDRASHRGAIRRRGATRVQVVFPAMVESTRQDVCLWALHVPNGADERVARRKMVATSFFIILVARVAHAIKLLHVGRVDCTIGAIVGDTLWPFIAASLVGSLRAIAVQAEDILSILLGQEACWT